MVAGLGRRGIHFIRVQAADGSSIPLQKALTINVIDVNEVSFFSGTSVNDVVNGTSGNDNLSGLDGNDVINGLGGNDVISGGNGDDILIGGAGADRILGGTGADTFRYDLLSESLFASSDIITGFNQVEGDRFNINTTPSTPIISAMNLGLLGGSNISAATATAGASLNTQDAVFFQFGSRNYLLVDNGNNTYSSSEDLFVTTQQFTFKAGDAVANRMLTVSDYFA